MLSQIVLAGLLPAIMAKPIMMRGESTHNNSPRQEDGFQHDGNLDAHDLYNPSIDPKSDCGCNKKCTDENDGIAGVMVCLTSCLDECPDGKDASQKRHMPANEAALPPYEAPAPVPTIPGQSATDCAIKCDEDCYYVGIPFAEFTQCRDSCSAVCSTADQSVIVIEDKAKRQDRPAPLQSGPALGSGATTYSGCMASCKSDCTDLEMAAINLSQCDNDCEAQCADFAHIHSSIFGKRDEKEPRQLNDLFADNSKSTPDHHNSGPAPLQSGPTVGTDATTYEGCMSRCHSNCMTANIPFELTQCTGGCEERCERFAHAESGILPRQLDGLTGLLGGGDSKPKPAPKKNQGAEPLQSGPTLGSGATSYEGCMSGCKSDCTDLEMTGALKLSQCEDSCENQCAGFAHAESGILPRQLDGLTGLLGGGDSKPKPAPKKNPGPAPLQSGPTLGNGATTYEGCMASCKSDCTDLEMTGALKLSQCDNDCESQCAGFAHASAGILPRENAVEKRQRPAPLQSGPTLENGATTYSGCMASCKSDCTNLEMAAINLSQCDNDCEAQCADFTHVGAGILPREDAIEKRHGPAPLQNGPVIMTGAVTYEGCMGVCQNDCQGEELAIELKRCNGRCVDMCSQYASGGTEIIGG
ncbi:hypothetical protein F4810DRAFT_679577 [Camillea tinctor]|nr:hypothetical protein F4810DRAFT_679577 [Camillea tinctor]